MQTAILKNLYQGENSVKMMIRNGEKIYQQLTRLVFEVDKDSIEFPASGGTDTLTITANEPWTMTKPEWITASQTSGTSTATITLSVSSTETERTGDIVIACAGKTKTISVVQGRDYSKEYFTIEALEDGDFYVRKANIGYSVNGGEWLNTTLNPINLKTGDKVRVKYIYTSVSYGLFSGNTVGFNVYGNVMSLGYGDNFAEHTECFVLSSLFEGCSGLVDASHLILPSMVLTGGGYSRMFYNCVSLTTAPELPATTLARMCYALMFHSCTSLTTATELPATNLVDYCYLQMFVGCRSINSITCLATDISATNCTSDWVWNVSPTGTFVKKAGVTWPTGNSGIPSGWTVIEE